LLASEAKSKLKAYSEDHETELSLTWKVNFIRLPNNTGHLEGNTRGHALGACFRNVLLVEFICEPILKDCSEGAFVSKWTWGEKIRAMPTVSLASRHS